MAIILGAGPPSRGDQPSALNTTSGHRRVLDWTIEAYRRLGPELHFVAGYNYHAILENYPDLSVVINARWQSTGSVGSLWTAPLRQERTCYVSYADVVFRENLVTALAQASGDVVLAVDRSYKSRYQSRTQNDLLGAEKVCLDGDGRVLASGVVIPLSEASAEFAGVVKLSPKALARVLELRGDDAWAKATIPALIEHLIQDGLDVRGVDIGGEWAELNAPQDLARFVLGTKAETLERLRGLVKHSCVGRQVRCTVEEWRREPAEVVARVAEAFGADALVVRSSALTEDGWNASAAGQFESLLNVANTAEDLSVAIDHVIASYGDDRVDHQVLIQKMLRDVRMSGVVFTRTLAEGVPYYTLNYDDTTSSTESVTSGAGRDLKTVVVHRSAVQNLPETMDLRVRAVFRAVVELEELVGHDSLDIEFAVTADEQVQVLQARPLVIDHTSRHLSDAQLEEVLGRAQAQFGRAQASHAGVVGARGLFGIMPDWNPAEIVGTRPRRLAVSLYQHLITDEVWATQRAEYGYRDVRPLPLLVQFAGHPYIDVRASFNSFVPAGVGDELAGRLVDHGLERLQANPHLHDKVEFDIAFTCLTFAFEERAKAQLVPAGFSGADIEALREGLLGITETALERYPYDLEQAEALEQRYYATMERELAPLERAWILLEDCRRTGTLAFAHLARGAFVAVSLLRSLVGSGLLSEEEQTAFLNALSTVAKEFERDGHKVYAGTMTWEAYVAHYGHLRPGTYEITSPCYRAEPERYLRPAVTAASDVSKDVSASVWSAATQQKLERALAGLGLDVTASVFESFLKKTIEGREWSKFVFTRNLSQALEDIAQFAESQGCSRETVAHVDIWSLLSLRKGGICADLGAFLRRRSDEGRAEQEAALAVELPPLLFDAADFTVFERFCSQPNFVTDQQVMALVVELSPQYSGEQDLTGAIVLIPQADPGYDWLFGHAIAGLITMYGGANSHMAIRAAELGLPAAIGVGELLYETISEASMLELDCGGELIRVVRS